MDSILLRFQIAIYSCTIFIIALPTVKINFTIVQLCFAIISLLIKIYRQIRLKHLKQIFIAQIKYYIAYLLTGIQIAFSIQSNQQLVDFKTENQLRIGILAISTINYSLICHQKLLSIPELVVYSFGVVIQILNLVSTTIFVVNFFDTRYDDDLEKDFILLETATGIAVGALILDLIFRAYEDKQKKE